MLGSIVAQVIPVVATPILAHLYTPAEFGVLTLYVSITTILAVIAAGRYEFAIGVPRAPKHAVTLVYLCGCLILVSATLTSFVVVFGNDIIASELGAPGWREYAYFLPISIVLIGIYQTLNYWLNRHLRFQTIAWARVIQTGSTALAAILGGIAKFGAVALICSTLVGYALGSLVSARAALQSLRVSKPVSFSRIWVVARRYKSFPMLSAPGALLDVAALQLPVIAVANSYGVDAAGFLGLTIRVVGIPAVFIGYAVGQVYYQTIAKCAASNQLVGGHIKRAAFALAFLGLAPFGVLLSFGEPMFSSVFGERWAQAGVFASVLAPAYWARFVVSPLSLSLPALTRNDLAIRWQAMHLATVAVSLVIAAQYSVMLFLTVYCIQQIALYALYLWLIFRAANEHDDDTKLSGTETRGAGKEDQ